jgi:hypothetical protein
MMPKFILVPALLLIINRKLELGFGLPIGVAGHADNFRSIVKLTYEF